MRESALSSVFAADVAAMRSLGAALGRSLVGLENPFVLALEGELGAGKTTLVGGVLNALGFAGHARSPTYTLIEPYEFPNRAVYHLDLYRLTDPREVDALGLRDLLQPRSIFLIEWPERGREVLPPSDLCVRVHYAAESGRTVSFSSTSNAGQSVLATVLATAKSEKPPVSS